MTSNSPVRIRLSYRGSVFMFSYDTQTGGDYCLIEH
jgi:hypothetical protein